MKMDKYSVEEMTTGEWAVYGPSALGCDPIFKQLEPRTGEDHALLHINRSAQGAAKWLVEHFRFLGKE
jgi:hypothetical protein